MTDTIKECEHYNPVQIDMIDTASMFMTGLLALLLLIALLRSQARNRALAAQLARRGE